MRAVVQRVTQARVRVDGEIVGEIRKGLVVLLGVAHDDTKADVDYLAPKIASLPCASITRRAGWSGSGVLGPEAFDAVPFLDLLTEYGSPWGLREG